MEKDTESKENSSSISSKATGVLENISIEYLPVSIRTKSERIAAALHLVSNFLSDSEPLKWSLRSNGLDVIRDSMELVAEQEYARTAGAKRVCRSLVEIVSELEIALTARLISEMNCRIIKTECERVLRVVETKLLPTERQPILGTDFFRLDDDEKKFHFPAALLPFDGAAKDTKTTSRSVSTKHADYKGHFVTHARPQYKTPGQRNYSLTHADSYGKKTERQNAIIGMLKKEGHLTIKDFSGVVKDRSEKTIQRELLEMVAKGVLKKEGERRWTRYSLASREI